MDEVVISRHEYELLLAIAGFIQRWNSALYEGDCPLSEIRYIVRLLAELQQIHDAK